MGGGRGAGAAAPRKGATWHVQGPPKCHLRSCLVRYSTPGTTLNSMGPQNDEIEDIKYSIWRGGARPGGSAPVRRAPSAGAACPPGRARWPARRWGAAGPAARARAVSVTVLYVTQHPLEEHFARSRLGHDVTRGAFEGGPQNQIRNSYIPDRDTQRSSTRRADRVARRASPREHATVP